MIENIFKTNNLNDLIIQIPKGKLPLMAKILPKNSARIFTKTPFADMKICNKCGVCIKLCPMKAINKDTLDINEDKCIRCFSCVKRCPKKARKIVYKPKFLVSKILTIKNKNAKIPQIYI
ncbi:4Fe-4S dicluster domain-containing protein [Clostridium saccharobutylicum]|nr:4Fe-4S dicluster domain-containing protein [Clostridium saccharobutylicum]MBA2904735.1 ferredoxin [Clostridium saccharobutylicum]MBA8896004.1 ferredoxin [Clostridium saccharobutylicum]MBA8981148.1 ferredoxin [Clostridium saccharobutylicum]MBA8999418.1 ferredoxin [Clostridium saccharobutylicum]MBA9010886.1 ferredoxin [Clostridium saccharobutylicum]